MTLEKDIEALCVDYLKRTGWFVVKIHQGSKYCKHKGISDRIAVKNKRVVFVEFKTKTGRQSEDQKKFESNIKEKGGEYILVRSLEELIREVG